MKKNFKILITFAALTAFSVSMAEEVTIPKLDTPSALQEGIQRELSAAQIAELLPWAKDSKIFLQDLMDQVGSLPMDQKIERLVDGIKQVVVESAPKQSELVMRYALNRALVINDLLSAETDEGVVGTKDAKARVLIASINLAMKYYDSDIANLTKRTALPYAAFGMEYFQFLHELNKSIFDASAQYNIQRTALEFLQWDMYRDLNNTSYAPQIVKINNALKVFPKKKMTDAHSINYIRQMKKVVEQLALGKSVEKSNSDKNNVLFSHKEEKEVIAPLKAGNFRLYDGKCYMTDKGGAILWDAGKQSWRQCHGGNYRLYDGKCYATDSSSAIIWDAGKISWNKCHASTYRVYDGKCYATDSSSAIIWDAGKVSPSSCHSSYRSYDGACYMADSSQAIIWDAGKVSPSSCQ